MPYLSVQTTGTNHLIYAAEADGSVIAYKLNSSNEWRPSIADNPTLSNSSGAGLNLFNSVITANSDKSIYTLTAADGGVRTFRVRIFPINGNMNFALNRPCLSEWRDHAGNFYSFNYGEDPTQSDYEQVKRIDGSNGSFIGFYYTGTSLNPTPGMDDVWNTSMTVIASILRKEVRK